MSGWDQWPYIGVGHGAKNTNDDVRKEGKDAPGNEGARNGQAQERIENRTQGKVAGSGDCDRAQGEQTVEEDPPHNGWQKRWREECRVAAEQAQAEKRAEAFRQDETRGRDPVAHASVEPYSVRIHLLNGQWIDLANVTVTWFEWLRSLQEWRGVALDTNFTPIGNIVHAAILPKAGAPAGPELGGNVVAFSGGKK